MVEGRSQLPRANKSRRDSRRRRPGHWHRTSYRRDWWRWSTFSTFGIPERMAPATPKARYHFESYGTDWSNSRDRRQAHHLRGNRRATKSRTRSNSGTLRVRLPDSKKSRIVLIGSARYESPDLQDVPAIENNLMELRRVSTSDSTGIISPENCTALINPKDQPTVGKLVTEAAEQAEDLLLIYYAGHGLLSLNRHELFLATGGTIAGSKLPFTGVDYSHIRDACLESRARTRVVILDCCYSGRAIPDTLSTTDQDSAFLGQVQVAGTYVMTASPGHAVAKAHPGARYTAFTGELLRILNEGIADGDELLTLNAIYKQLYGSLRASGNPIPRQQTTENSDVMALARNYAHNRLEAPPKPSPPMVTPRPSPMESPTPLSSTSFIPDEVIQILQCLGR